MFIQTVKEKVDIKRVSRHIKGFGGRKEKKEVM